jgi:hypothetical protein
MDHHSAQSNKFSTNVWAAACMAAFGITADIELVTFGQAVTQSSASNPL